ncbi:hypothetical protein BS47DRAFT_1466052 [Hydnum rufescens UP504]|uniref:Palmitoyltransferase n=1 Tax=Hydnum rufescens UP504 TaxID=1448309 RepID=A0A9P6DVX8_9AGAM|nr:hypothetical protein BS47DRAFT_1466052 [Hydnum rufescens UP504]
MPSNTSRSRWVGFTGQIKRRRTERREGPQPYVVRKLMIVFVFAITAYAVYVYIGRLCIAMVRQKPKAMGSRGQGIAYIIIFSFLSFMCIWTYMRVIITPPGFAADHVEQSPPPEARSALGPTFDSSTSYNYSTRAGPPYTSDSSNTLRNPPDHDIEKTAEADYDTRLPPASSSSSTPDASPAQAYIREYADRMAQHSPQVAISQFPSADANRELQLDAMSPITTGAAQIESDATQPVPFDVSPSRRPPTYPMLAPEYRYCRREEILKPPRTHHCRICGKCVLMYDHHCPWVGQCIGVHNRRFFVIFNYWSALFAIWIAITLLVATATHPNIADPQEIVITAIAALFAIFTSALGITHTILIIYNLTTVEHLFVSKMKERERSLLSRHFSFYQCRQKRNKLREWDQEWGRLGMEGNLWWLGSARKNWKAVMGDDPWYWFFPIGSTIGNGLSYPMNPRFSEDGRWRPRSEWPTEYR